MKQIQVLKDVLYATNVAAGAITENSGVNTLRKGGLAIMIDKTVDATTALMDITGNLAAQQALLADAKTIQFFVGKGDTSGGDGAYASPVINTRGGVRVIKQIAVSPVKQVQFIGDEGGAVGNLNLPTAAEGNEIIIKIQERMVGTLSPTYRKTTTYRYTAADTNGTAITNVIAQLNADMGDKATFVVVGAQVGIQVTAVENNVILEISLDGVIANATLATGTAMTHGVNQGSQVYDYWKHCSTEEGDTNDVYFSKQMFTATNPVDTTITYITYTLIWTNVRETAVGADITATHVHTIAVPTGCATFQTAQFEIFLAAAFGDIDESGLGLS